jgi:hypothetical protein
MSDCSFSIPFDGDPGSLITTARTAITEAGGRFSGDNASGEFSLSLIGTLKGSYSVEGQSLNIVISKKPAILSCGRIEKELKKYLQKEYREK